MDFIEIVRDALQMDASDIHLAAGNFPLVRIGGKLCELPSGQALTSESCKTLIYSFLMDHQKARFEADMELDCSIQVKDLARLRINVLMQRNSVEAVLRLIPAEIPRPQELGIGTKVLGLCDLPQGLVLVTGPTGAGKSTTLACLIDQINEKSSKHILTIEDPVEFIHERKKSLVRHRELGVDTLTFHEALRHALRQDPDVILIGELRDLETISLALTAAETGHLVLASLHTGSAVQTVNRIVDVFPAEQQQQIRTQLADSLQAVISQILLPVKNHRHRIAARELLMVTPAVSNLIREGKSHMIANVLETGSRDGMFSMAQCLGEMVRKGVVDVKDALVHAPNLEKNNGSSRPVPNMVIS